MQRVLVVDDTKVIRELVARYLDNFDAEILFAGTGNEGLAQFEATHPDLVISDIEMPGISGVEFVEKVREASGGRTKVILMSAGAAPAGRAAVARGVADAFLPKPLDEDEFRDWAARLLATVPVPSTKRRRERQKTIRILIADDTAVGRKMLERTLAADSAFEIVGTARDGQEAVELAIKLKPLLILLDEIMPELDGISATREIMRKAPTRVVVMTQPSEGGNATVFDATKAGAVDFLVPPDWNALGGSAAANFRERLKELAEVPVVRHRLVTTRPSRIKHDAKPGSQLAVVAICTSTGGPGVLANMLKLLAPAIERVPVLIVQHVLSGFADSLASWLTEVSGVRVQVAQDTDPLEPGRVYLAPDGKHLSVESTARVAVSPGAPVGAHCPSGTILFRTVADIFGEHALGVVLTGMGEDGIDGVEVLKERGGLVFVQSPETCVVPGMVNAAIERDLASAVLPPEEIADQVVKLVTRERKA